MRLFYYPFAFMMLAAASATAEETDFSSSIVNASFESNGLEGWTNNGFQSQTNNSPADMGWQKDGNVYAEKWTHEPDHLDDASLYQKVTGLENGEYRVVATGHAVNQSGEPATVTGAQLYTPTRSTEISTSGEHEVTGTAAEGFLIIGVRTVGTDANWVAVDNFRIYRTGESLAGYREYVLALAQELLPLFKEAAAIDSEIASEGDVLYAEVRDAETKDKIFKAIGDLRALETQAREALQKHKEAQWVFDRMRSEIRIAEDFYADSNYPGKAVFRTAIDAAIAAEASGKSENFDAAIAALKKASADYLAGRPEEWTRIRNGAMWRDADGKDVQAHGAGFLRLNDRFYMIGEDRSNSWNPDVNMYSSTDLVNWRFERKIIGNGVAHPDLGKDRMIERPKIGYNPLTGKFVVWCHWEAGNYGASEAGVFYADRVNDAYTFHSGSRPLGVKSRDCNLYIDDDNTAYFISTTNENTNLGLFRLSDDWLEPVEHTSLFEGQRREAPVIVKHEGRYYMLSSACSGWDPNRCQLAVTEDLTSGWSGLRNLGNPISFDTQAASILKIEGTKATTYLYVGDRWQDPDLPESKTVIFPISFTEKNCTFEYVPEFEINFVTGELRKVENDPTRIDRSSWTVADCSSEETKGEHGEAANTIDGDSSTIWHTRYSSPSGTAPHHLAIDMGTTHKISAFLATPRMDSGTTNGLIREFAFQVSLDGSAWTTVSAGSWLPYGAQVHFKPSEARYFRLISLSGAYASLSEIDVYKNTPEYLPATIAANYQIGSGGWTSGTEIDIESGKKLTFGPWAPTGSWAWECPGGTFVATREHTISKTATAHAGAYTAWWLDMFNCSHSLTYNLTVDGVVNEVSETGADVEVISRAYYSLDGLPLSEAPEKGICIMLERHADGSIRTKKLKM